MLIAYSKANVYTLFSGRSTMHSEGSTLTLWLGRDLPTSKIEHAATSSEKLSYLRLLLHSCSPREKEIHRASGSDSTSDNKLKS
jgi:hypothetical protein